MSELAFGHNIVYIIDEVDGVDTVTVVVDYYGDTFYEPQLKIEGIQS